MISVSTVFLDLLDNVTVQRLDVIKVFKPSEYRSLTTWLAAENLEHIEQQSEYLWARGLIKKWYGDFYFLDLTPAVIEKFCDSLPVKNKKLFLKVQARKCAMDYFT